MHMSSQCVSASVLPAPSPPDECYAVSHDSAGVLGMANCGRHTNSSQFYITLQPALWMDRKYVAFGYATYPHS